MARRARKKAATIEEAMAELEDSAHGVLLRANAERMALESIKTVPTQKAAQVIGTLMMLLSQAMRLIRDFAKDNKRLREESMEMKRVNRATAGIVFQPVSKSELN